MMDIVAPKPHPARIRIAREYVAAGWTKYADARDLYGKAVDFDDPSATCFCLNGGMLRGGCGDAEFEAMCDAARGIGEDSFINFNDRPATTKVDVLRVMDTAIRIAEKAA